MSSAGIDVVTGAFSYSGRFIAQDLLASGRTLRTLTGHPRANPDPRIETLPYRFDDYPSLVRSLEGASVLYNTYWVRFNRGEVTYDLAVANSQTLFAAARDAGVDRIVHVSIANPSASSLLPYYRGKALVEEALADCGIDYAIVRPTVFFGHGDVLINNIAWFLRRLHAVGVPGSGEYPIQPVHVEDVARICIEAAAQPSGVILDAAGPEKMTFRELVTAVRKAIGARAIVLNMPPRAALQASRLAGLFVRDVVLTPEEVEGLCAGLLAVEGPVSGRIGFRDWLNRNGPELGRTYANELRRHFGSQRTRRP